MQDKGAGLDTSEQEKAHNLSEFKSIASPSTSCSTPANKLKRNLSFA